MTINEILSSEIPGSGIIRLYPEGIFYKAYEYSAYLFVHHIRSYRLKRRYYKNAATDVVSTGFPMAAFDSLPLPHGATVSDGPHGEKQITICKTVDEQDFAAWKGKDETPHSLPEAKSCEAVAVERIRQFNLESATPLSCMMFLAEIREILK